MSGQQREMIKELRSYGVSSQEHAVKNPGAAAALNLLPGIGNIYNAVGTDETNQYGHFALNLLLYPISPIWGIPEAAVDANAINKKETANFYLFDPEGKKKLEVLRSGNK